MNKLLKLVFDRRGYTSDFLRQMKDTSRNELMHAHDMAGILHANRHRRITVLGDFDVDGVMSGIVGFAGLSELGFKVHLYTPDPMDGYEWGRHVIDKLVSQFPDTEVLLTCDSGTSCHEGIRRAKELGLIVLVTDHHKQVGILPDADSVVNPMQAGETYEHGGICGCHVLYQVLLTYAMTYGTPYLVSQIAKLRVFAGIATVTDLMPVLYESREMIEDAITICNMLFPEKIGDWTGSAPYTNAFLGIGTLLRGLAGARKLYGIDEELFGWQIGPMFNSPKRLGHSVSDVFCLFLSGSEQDRSQAFARLCHMNEERKVLVAKALSEIKSETSYQPYAPLIYFTDAFPGVLGLIAAKLSQESGMPCLVVNRDADNFCHGSGRSPEWLPFFVAAEAVSVRGFSVRGHDHAFGCNFPGEKGNMIFSRLSEYAEEALGNLTVGEDDHLLVGNAAGVDVGLDYHALKSFYFAAKAFKPFGKGFPEPRVVLKLVGAKNCIAWNRMGSDNQHIKGVFAGGFDILLWNQGELPVEEIDALSIEGTFSESNFQGNWGLTFVGTVMAESHGEAEHA